VSQRFIRNLLRYMPSKILPALSGFNTLPIITMLFPPEEYERPVLAECLAGFVVAAFYSGFGSGVVRFFLEYKRKSQLGRYFMALDPRYWNHNGYQRANSKESRARRVSKQLNQAVRFVLALSVRLQNPRNGLVSTLRGI
jgi:hypothetical protein